jgi:hypothetical protein
VHCNRAQLTGPPVSGPCLLLVHCCLRCHCRLEVERSGTGRRQWRRSRFRSRWSSRGCYGGGSCCTTRRRNAHGTDVREVLYQWHPWTGRQVYIHEVVERAGCDVFRCSIAGSAADRWLEIPAWMFDRAVCGMVRVDGTPRVASILRSMRSSFGPLIMLQRSSPKHFS